jgi:beta-lactam-binding protein with PASTA domain
MKFRNLFANIYIKNILIALAILIALILLVLVWLNIYTLHGKEVVIPNVKGLQVAQAAPLLENQSLHCMVVDSIYAKNKPAGSIVETVPPVGTKVKEGRTIYLTVSSLNAHLLTVPAVIDMSQRQAMAMLQSLGFESIQVVSVSGAYKGLVVGLQTIDNRQLEAGNRIPANTSLVLLVNSGEEDIESPDSAETPAEDSEEYWY